VLSAGFLSRDREEADDVDFLSRDREEADYVWKPDRK
jgi:hypothetical protein